MDNMKNSMDGGEQGGLFMSRLSSQYNLTRNVSQSLIGGGVLAAFFSSIALLPAIAADVAKTNSGIPQLMQEPGVSWTGFVRHEGPADPTDYAHARTFNEWSAPASGIGPVTDGPAYPFNNNEVARQTGRPSTYRVVDLSNEAGKNLMPWVQEALKKQNALVLKGRNGETRQARCWEQGVPDIHEAPFSLYFIQMPTEVVMIQGGKVRRVYLNAPHSKNPRPSWFGESVGHYEEGDTLVVDTIGLNDRTFVDGYRTPHTTQEHVIERFKITDGGKKLDVSFTVDDPGAFYKPWGATRPRFFVKGQPLSEDACASNNDDKFNQGFEEVPTARKADF
jgi:hypothetical protein